LIAFEKPREIKIEFGKKKDEIVIVNLKNDNALDIFPVIEKMIRIFQLRKSQLNKQQNHH
jgi:hypothetical protein